jgi:MFS family permease
LSERGRLGFIAFYSVYYVARGFSSLLIPLYFVSVGIPVISVGLAIAVFGGSLLVFEIMWGVLYDRLGSDWLVFFGVAVAVVTYASIPFVKTAEAATVVEFVLGASSPILAVIGRSNVVSASESRSWAGGFGVLGAAYSLSQLAGYTLGGLSATSEGFADSFYISALLTVVAYSTYLLFSRRGPKTPVQTSLPPVEPKSPRPPLDWRGLPLLGLVAVPTFIGYAFFVNIMQLIVTETPSIAATKFEAGLVVSCYWLSTAIFQPIISLRGSAHARRWIGIAMLASSGVFVLMTHLYSVWALAGGTFLWGICFSTISPLSLSLLMVGIPKRYVGRAMGIYGAAEDVGIILGPLIGSAVWIEYGLTATYLTIGATYLAVLVPYALASWLRPGRTNR